MSRYTYKEIARAKVSETRNVVISQCSGGGFTIAQQLDVQEGDKKMTVFLKNSIHLDDVKGLYELRDTINYALKSIESSPKDEEEWDH